MTNFAVVVAPNAKRQIKKLDRRDQRKIIRRLEQLREDPRPPDVDKLTENKKLWRIKAGDYRIIYHILKKEDVVIVLVVRHRKDAYRDLDQVASMIKSIDITGLIPFNP